MADIKKTVITQIKDNDMFLSILDVYKTELTSCTLLEIDDDISRTGFLNTVYCITINGKLISILVPLFSTSKTITWDYSYLDKIKNIITNKYKKQIDISNIIKLVLFEHVNDTTHFLSITKLVDMLQYGLKGKNGNSVYFWLQNLPNNKCLNKTQLQNDLFKNILPFMTKEQIKEYAIDYANKYYMNYGDTHGRNKQEMITNIADGTYIELMMYVELNKKYNDVELVLTNGDDKGVDIIITENNVSYNIDVKSTSGPTLKINRLREQTDFYAVCVRNNTKKGYTFLGFLNKYDFWESNAHNSKKPKVKNGVHVKDLKELKKRINKTLDTSINNNNVQVSSFTL
jgi:hypothetical protein